MATARSRLAHFAMEQECTELVFWDKDLLPELHQLGRLLSHDLDIVCAQYAKRGLPTAFHGQELVGETVNLETGIQKMTFAPIGFAKIKTGVFSKLMEVFPEREHMIVEIQAQYKHHFEFFPAGLIGPNTSDGKIARIKQVIDRPDESALDVVRDITEIINDSDYSKSHYYGEDYFFCHLCRKAGFDINLDTTLIIPHVGETTFPITNAEINAMAKEPWRQLKRQ